MAPTLVDLFRTLSSFAPARVNLRAAPWEEYVDWAISQGLAPLAAYNLEYRLAGGGAPEWARDRLLSIYQGSVNDNVMKLVNFKRTVDELEGRSIVLLGGASFAEVLYPHVGFRPVLDVQLLVRAADLDGLSNFLGTQHFRPTKEVEDARGAERVLSDGNTPVLLYTSLGASSEPGALLPAKVYGPSFFRLSHEEALLAVCLDQARNGYDVPLLTFVDLRELIIGAPSVSGPYSKAVDHALLKKTAEKWGASRALYASASIVARLFPETADTVSQLLPELPAAVRVLIEAAVVGPLSEVGRTSELKLKEIVRRALTGG
ncbi:MAG: nucleotidyltransferase family protein [Myxococcaceae bacterium]